MKKVLLFLFMISLLIPAIHANATSITITPDPLFGYIPLSVFGGTIDTGATDESISNFTVPAFDWAGETWSTIGIVSNGYIVVGGGASADVDFINTDLPDPAAPNNILAPFWTDLNPGAGGRVLINVLTDGTDTWSVVEWEEVPNFGDGELNTFQVWIRVNTAANSSENIHFVYDEVSDGDGSFLTVGAEDKTGTVGTAYYFDGSGTLPIKDTQLLVSSSGLPVPEPSTMLLIGTGLVGLAGFRRRFRKRLD